MKIIRLIILIVILSAFEKSDKLQEIKVINSVGDTAILFKKDSKETFFVFIMEPSCTGCKNNLAKVLRKKGNVIIITNYYLYIEDRKVSQKYFSGLFPYSKQIYFLNSDNQHLNILNLNSKKTPCIVWFSSKTKSYSVFNYDDIFVETSIKKSFQNQLYER